MAQAVMGLGLALAVTWVPFMPIALASSQGQVMYKYVNRQGRTVYVGSLSLVPSAYRKKVQRVPVGSSSNAELGRDLNKEGKKEVARVAEMRAEDPCSPEAMRRRSSPTSKEWWQVLWAQHGHLVATGGGMLLLVVATPLGIRWMEPAKWVKLLIVALPLLAIVGGVSHLVVKGTRKLQDAKAMAGVGAPACPGSPAAAADPAQKLEGIVGSQEERAGAMDQAIEAEVGGSPAKRGL
ncbi:MAG: hypothetical protein HY698_18330 [Deltaproteobacteria bacterium]|nr:hypothetical protein [Deltaproteobacteria bacterium]